MTLDVIGLAGIPLIQIVPTLHFLILDTGFNYKFDALDTSGKPNELNQAFTTMFRANMTMGPMPVLQALFPVLRWIVRASLMTHIVDSKVPSPQPTERDTRFQQAQRTMTRIGSQLLRDSKASIEASKGGSVEKSSWQARDLLSLLVRANMATDLPDSQRLTDADVLSRMYLIFPAFPF
jgi:hypothetical protein